MQFTGHIFLTMHLPRKTEAKIHDLETNRKMIDKALKVTRQKIARRDKLRKKLAEMDNDNKVSAPPLFELKSSATKTLPADFTRKECAGHKINSARVFSEEQLAQRRTWAYAKHNQEKDLEHRSKTSGAKRKQKTDATVVLFKEVKADERWYRVVEEMEKKKLATKIGAAPLWKKACESLSIEGVDGDDSGASLVIEKRSSVDVLAKISMPKKVPGSPDEYSILFLFICRYTSGGPAETQPEISITEQYDSKFFYRDVIKQTQKELADVGEDADALEGEARDLLASLKNVKVDVKVGALVPRLHNTPAVTVSFVRLSRR